MDALKLMVDKGAVGPLAIFGGSHGGFISMYILSVSLLSIPLSSFLCTHALSKSHALSNTFTPLTLSNTHTQSHIHLSYTYHTLSYTLSHT